MKENLDKIQDRLEKKHLKSKAKKMVVSGKGAFIIKQILDKKTGK